MPLAEDDHVVQTLAPKGSDQVGEPGPKTSIACAELRTPDRAPENGQLMTQRHVLERDGSVSTTEQPERSKQHDTRGQHA